MNNIETYFETEDGNLWSYLESTTYHMEEDDEEYQTILNNIEEILDKYPNLREILEDGKVVELTLDDAKAVPSLLNEYLEERGLTLSPDKTRITHIKDGFIYEKNEEISEINYKKSGFNRIYSSLESYGLISGSKNNQEICISNIIVKSEKEELFRGIFAYSTISSNADEIDVMSTNSQNNKKEKFNITSLGLYIYAENMKESRKIITDEVIKYMEQFVDETKIKFELMINKNMIFFRFFDKNILTRPISNEKETKAFLYKYYRIIEFISNFNNF